MSCQKKNRMFEIDYLAVHNIVEMVYLLCHVLKWKSSQEDGLVNAVVPSARWHFFHDHIVKERGVKRETGKHYCEVQDCE